jgi:amino acid adenylation domain-containing protein
MHPRSIYARVASAAERDPSKVAVRSERGDKTYAELISAALGIAGALQRAGVRPGDRVGLWMEKTPACIQAALGILASGAAYVPLDPRAPWRRCRTIALDCELSALIVDLPRLAALADLLEGLDLRTVLVDAPARAAEEAIEGKAPWQRLETCAAGTPAAPNHGGESDVAYILYTSGSTGAPKGVVHTHGSALSFVQWVQDRFAIRPDDVFSSHAPLHFDLSISDLWVSLGAGAEVRLFDSTEAMLPPHLVRVLSEGGITVWYSVPSALVSMLDRGGLELQRPERLRLLFFAGEVFPTPQLRRLRGALPQVALFNLFGPTETNVCTYYEVPSELEGDAPIPIGRGCENLETFAVDEAGVCRQESGAEGTLWVRGGNLMKGYWNDPERTARMLQPDPRGRPGFACCTGDRVRLRPDGAYEFLGRRDHLVKSRGYRIELGEIEATLAAHPEVREAVAVPVPDAALGHRIVATVVPRPGASPDAAGLRAFCGARLPGYMVPERLEVRNELPRTSTGKADRNTLKQAWTRVFSEGEKE